MLLSLNSAICLNIFIFKELDSGVITDFIWLPILESDCTDEAE